MTPFRRSASVPRSLPLLAVLALFLAAPALVHAQGFGVYEQGTCAMGRAGATVAQPCNSATAMFYNPAGVAGTQGFTVSGGVTVVAAVGDYTDDLTGEVTDLQNDPIPVPHLYLAYGADERLGFGLGVFVPYGLGTVWPEEDFEGRFLGYDNHLQSVYVQPTVAYRLTERLRVGAGFDVVIGAVTLTQRLDLAEQVADPATGTTFAQLGIPTGTDFGNVQLEGSGVGFGGHVGVLFEATERLSFGARFMAPVKMTYEGEADFDPVETGIVLPADNPLGAPAGTPLDVLVAGSFDQGPLVDQDIETEITLPAMFVGGVAVQATPRLLLLADYQWTGWSSFDRLPLDFEQDVLDSEQIEEYDDTHGLRLGAEFAATDALLLRAGFLTHGSAAPEQTITPLLPEGYRNEFTVGLGYRFTPTVRLDAAYHFLNQNERRGRVTDYDYEAGFDPATDNDGLYSFDAHLFGLTVTARF